LFSLFSNKLSPNGSTIKGVDCSPGLISLNDEIDVDDDDEKGSRSIENVLAVGKFFSGSLW